ncbi:hypothetical protein [Xylanimonas protaetiae]|uniref:Heavy metal transporter n=1 Tax=Xylanimonas protaetiae TaxID=2509457 RepID=A0A4P6FID6_9MICO|nr:hypothetical protein [Xylanimonas protaetiae]QAY70328.1 hypothetical protein ET471_10030 [Xylanimonas protaetiae]
MSTRAAVRRRRRRALVSVVAAVAVVGAGAWWALERGSDTPARQRCSATLDGTDWYLSPAQAENAALVAGATVRRALPARAATIGLATALQESKLINLDYGDRDSLGLFQQRPSQGWGAPEQVLDPLFATNAFYDALVQVPGYEDLPVTVAAQAVQRSGFPEAYAQHETRSRAWASALTGHSPAAVSCQLDPVADPRPADDATAALAERAARDLGLGADAVVVTSPRQGPADDGVTVRIDATPLPTGDPARAAWAAAQWAVAAASVTDVVEVRVADRVWTRPDAVHAARDGENPWRPADDGALAAGSVTLRLAAAG